MLAVGIMFVHKQQLGWFINFVILIALNYNILLFPDRRAVGSMVLAMDFCLSTYFGSTFEK